MTVSELIVTLKAFPQDALVCVYADHGQYTMKASTCCLQSIRTEDLGEAMMEAYSVDVGDEEVAEETALTQVVEIGAP